ncbi:MAG: hypothetical protein J07HQW1_00922 [Haloquadratum walsbyi J07HQW1]|uniref:Uncharacterized protein n=1 Tax=Haloquadratum walsbyi J07HQW1 TaxID=1238424 RepID=U1MME1_9EURY|nr:MAG: hypothetical protein J07HQW1_00922 [Haloquadratum walsbyi J07HQW1]
MTAAVFTSRSVYTRVGQTADMRLDSIAPTIGAFTCLILAGVVFVPAVIITTPGVSVADYYAAGPFGISVVGFLAILNIVVFLAGKQGRTDPVTVAGIALVSGIAMIGFAAVWAVSITSTLLYGFPSQYAWIVNHRWVIVGLASVTALAGSGYTTAVLR